MFSRKVLLIIAFTSYIFYAVLATEIGPVLPEIRIELNLSQAIIGIIAGLQSLAGILAVLGGFLSDIFGRTRFISISLAMMGVGAIFISTSPTALTIGLSFFIMGTGFSFFEASVNAYISNLFSEKRGMSMNILHIGWSVGSTAGPLVAAIMILTYGSWRLGYLLIVPLIVIFSIVFGVLIPKTSDTLSMKEKEELDQKYSKKNIMISSLPIILASFLLMASKLGMNNWLPYILRDQGGTIIESSLTISIFWMLIGIGRIIWAPFVDRIGFWKTITLNSIGALILFIFAALPIPLYFRMILYSIAGLLMGPLYPTLLACGTKLYPERSGTLVGAIYASGMLGTVFSTIIIGLIIERLGTTIAQIIFPISIGFITIISYLSIRYDIGKVSRTSTG
ncbi:MAG: MFS transporter [Candidatus Caldarchaeales archaeon]